MEISLLHVFSNFLANPFSCKIIYSRSFAFNFQTESKEKLENAQKELDDCRLLIQQHEAKIKSLTENMKEVCLVPRQLISLYRVSLIVKYSLGDARKLFCICPSLHGIENVHCRSGFSRTFHRHLIVKVQILQTSSLSEKYKRRLSRFYHFIIKNVTQVIGKFGLYDRGKADVLRRWHANGGMIDCQCFFWYGAINTSQVLCRG